MQNTKMESSADSSLSSEWDVINFNSDNIEEICEESPDAASNDCNNEIKPSPSKGSCVEPLEETDAGDTCDATKETSVDGPEENLSDTDNNRHNLTLSEEYMDEPNDSNTSSDVDVIEESPEDLQRSRMLRPHLEIIAASLVPNGSLVAGQARNINYPYFDSTTLINRFLSIPRFKVYTFIVIISFATAITLEKVYRTPGDKIKLMKDQVDKLKKENTELKSLVNLEEQIHDLKKENKKLTGSLQSLIGRLQEQTTLFEKANNLKKRDPYKAEIDKLKEQVNILQIDNEDLQQQLVRIRYGGAYSPYPDGTKEAIPEGKEASLDQNDNETSAEVLSEEIEKLKKQLYTEVDELKNWKESINNVIKQLDEKEKKGHHKSKAAHEEKHKKHTNSETHNKESDNDDQYYEWSWKDWKKNFGDTFDSIKFPEFSRYAKVDGEKVKQVFESVGQYFKKAQDKTRKMFNNYKQKGKEDVWEFLGSLRKKWAEMKEDFFKNEFKKGPIPPNDKKFASDFKKPNRYENEKKIFADKTNVPGKNKADDSVKFASDLKKPTRYDNEKKIFEDKTDVPGKNEADDSVVQFLMNHPNMKKIIGDDPDWQAKFRKFLEEEEKLTENGNKPENSWIFSRAEVRNILREKDLEDKEEATNWFLRKKKTAGEDGSGVDDLFDNNE